MTDSQPKAEQPKPLYMRWWVLALGGIVIFMVGFGVGTASSDVAAEQEDAAAGTTTTTTAPATTSTTTTTTAPTTSTSSTTTTTTQPFVPTTDDFTIELILLDKSCFGSAGANLQMDPELTVSNSALLRGSGEWLVIYEIDPVEDGPEVANIEVDLDDGSYTYNTLILQTDDCDDEPLATVTNVRER